MSTASIEYDDAATFGIVGNFPGDDELLAELQWCGDTFSKAENPKPPLARLVTLLDRLPLKGRNAVVRRYLAKSPHRDAIVRDLFEYCFQQDEDEDYGDKMQVDGEDDEEREEDEFVLIANPTSSSSGSTTEAADSAPPAAVAAAKPLNGNRFHIFQVVLVLMAASGPAGADLSRRYLNTTASTKYRPKILIQIVESFSPQDFSNEELWKHYQESPRSVQDAVVKACQRSKARPLFLQMVDQDQRRRTGETLRYPDLMYWCPSDYVAAQLEQLVNTPELNQFQLAHWGKHGSTYLEFLRRRMTNSGPDKLKRGGWWSYFYGRLDTASMQSDHVRALQLILQEFPSCYIFKSVNDKATTQYLQELSAKGGDEDVENFVDLVKRYHLPPALVETKLTKKERFEYVVAAFNDKDWDRFTQVKNLSTKKKKKGRSNHWGGRGGRGGRGGHFGGRGGGGGDANDNHSELLVPRHKLPYKDTFKAVGMDAFWARHIQSDSNNDLHQDKFFGHLAHKDLYQQAPLTERASILECWTDLHRRCKPSDLTEEQRKQYGRGGNKSTLEWMWKRWYASYGMLYQGSCWDFDGLSSEEPRQHKMPQKQVQHAQLVLQLALQALQEEGVPVLGCLSVTLVLKPVRELLNNIPCSRVAELKDDDPRKEIMMPLIQQGASIIVDHVLPLLSGSVQFDPAVENTYVNQESLNLFSTVLSEIGSRWQTNEQVTTAIMSLVLDVHLRAQTTQTAEGASFVVTAVASGDNDNSASSPPQKKSKKFAYFKADLHKDAQRKCRSLAMEFLRHQKDADALYAKKEMIQKVWDLLKNEQDSAAKKQDPTEWLQSCQQYCPKHLLEEEKPSLIAKSRAFVITTAKDNHRWKDALAPVAKQLQEFGWLELVLDLDDEEIPMNVKHSLLVDHAGFANEKVRQNLKDQTYAASGEERAEGLNEWLQQACATEQMSLIDEALAFAAGRVKNESGANRKTVFAWLEKNFASDIVVPSLHAKDLDVALVDRLCAAILSIQQNDLNRLDSVGRYVCFPRLPQRILGAVLAFDPTRVCLERRRRWIDCSIRLHWDLDVASNGDERSAYYSWPIPQLVLKSAVWISQEDLDVLYPPSKPSSSVRLAKLGTQLGHTHQLSWVVRKGFNKDNTFGPAQCVGLLVEAINSVWRDEIAVPALLVDGRFRENDQQIASAQRARLEGLFQLCGTVWEEVDFLASAFDNIFKDIESAPRSHVVEASALLDKIMQIHGESFGYYDGVTSCPRAVAYSPRLANACDKLFRVAVATQWIAISAPRWQSVYLERGSRVWTDVEVGDRAKNFVYNHSDGCEPDCWRLVVDKTGRIQREAEMAKELLDISTSALFLDCVQKVLFTRRQDVLARYLKEEVDPKGVFRGSEEQSLSENLFTAMDNIALLSCNSSVSKWYAKFALDKAGTSRADLESRVQAIHKFMSSPSTQHADVLAALQGDLDDAVREALINRVFSLDSPWHILGHLLSRKAIEKNDQRVTAALLGYVARHVHVDKVVRVVGLLLGKRRRKKLSFQLHKGAIRMLFDAGTPEAMALLRKEWDNELSDGVRALVIEKCMEAVVAGKTEGWEATVLSRVATDNSFEAEVKFVLLAPQRSNRAYGSIDIRKAAGVATDETLDLYRRKQPNPVYVNSSPVARKLSAILKELESSSTDETLSFLARLKKLALSDLFASDPVDDQEALDDMLLYLTTPPSSEDAVDHKTQAGFPCVAEMFGAAATRVLAAALGLSSEKMDLKDIKEKCAQLAAVIKLRGCVRSQLDKALDLPARHHLQRTLVLNSLQSLILGVQAYSLCQGMDAMLVMDPFKKDFELMSKDASLVSQICLPFLGGRL
ncbi:expressed unknown protein [Seminavis robusta]|uniref:Uncharacterized protein n=1 Tax=Seminavis robusta TaxID=568900 RepID=A0A9N8EAY2_9STRA|nr:expressed unknown protein [Seminavis robusta]|eukprot:Sro860_g212110.1 n/a (1844) ;mRNA; r:6158-11689